MRVFIRVERRLIAKLAFLRERLRDRAILAGSKEGPSLRSLPSSSALLGELARAAARRAHEDESRASGGLTVA